ncbi:MAG: ribokinase [Pirellulaceae bacterium]
MIGPSEIDCIVVGSMNLDWLIECPKLPARGETVGGCRSRKVPGGKGANQAVAAARSGARVAMVGAVGKNEQGQFLIEQLKKDQVDFRFVQILSEVDTGTAIVAVESSGENAILVIPGANNLVTSDQVRGALSHLPDTAGMLLQGEIPADAIVAAAEEGRRKRMRVILNPAPMLDPFPELLWNVDLLIVNEGEAKQLSSLPLNNAAEALEVATWIHSRGPQNVVITLGAGGAVFRDLQGRCKWFPAVPTQVVDTTAAGDCFVGALASRWLRGESLEQSVQYALTAASIAVSRLGAQPSLPYQSEVLAMINR